MWLSDYVVGATGCETHDRPIWGVHDRTWRRTSGRAQAHGHRAKRVLSGGWGREGVRSELASGATTGPRGARSAPPNPDEALARSAPPNPELVRLLLFGAGLAANVRCSGVASDFGPAGEGFHVAGARQGQSAAAVRKRQRVF